MCVCVCIKQNLRTRLVRRIRELGRESCSNLCSKRFEPMTNLEHLVRVGQNSREPIFFLHLRACSVGRNPRDFDGIGIQIPFLGMFGMLMVGIGICLKSHQILYMWNSKSIDKWKESLKILGMSGKLPNNPSPIIKKVRLFHPTSILIFIRDLIQLNSH